MNTLDSFPARLRAALKDSGKSAAEVYRRIGVSKATWYTWTGERESTPEPETCFKLADCLGVMPRWLITGNGPRMPIAPRFTQEQLDLAEAWPSLPAPTQQAIAMLIRSAANEMAPGLKGPPTRLSREMQERADRLFDEAQKKLRSASR